MDKHDKASAPEIRSLVLFRQAPEATVEEVRRDHDVVEVEAGEAIFERGDPGREVYLVLSGLVRIFGAAPAGMGVAFADLGRGECLGEMAAIDGRLRSGRAVAVEKTRLLRLEQETFLALLRGCPEVGLELVRRLVGIIRRMDERVVELSTLSETVRVCRELVRIARPAPNGDGTWSLDPMPAHREISIWAGVPETSVAGIIGWLMRENILHRAHHAPKVCAIADMEALRRAAQLEETAGAKR